MVGKVLWFDIKKGFGFIRSNGADIFVHYSKIEAPLGEFRALTEGDSVEFELFDADRGDGKTKPQAKNVKLIEGGQRNAILRKDQDHNFRGHDQRAETDSTL
jgi:CspA family cold shock protein